MDNEDVADAVAQRLAPQGPETNWDGRIARNPRTGERLVYRMNPSGRGRFVALNAETADPQARERVEALQNRASIGQRTLTQAQRFVEQNFRTPTGGLQNTLEGPLRALAAAVAPDTFSSADELAALSNQMIGSNWQPGTSTMMNTATEQEMIRRRYPSPSAQGPANMQTYLNMAEEVAVQQEALANMRQWLTQHPNLNNWEAQWAPREAAVRARARAAALEQMRTYQQQNGGGDAGRVRQGYQPRVTDNAPQRPQGPRLRYNPATGQLE